MQMNPIRAVLRPAKVATLFAMRSRSGKAPKNRVAHKIGKRDFSGTQGGTRKYARTGNRRSVRLTMNRGEAIRAAQPRTTRSPRQLRGYATSSGGGRNSSGLRLRCGLHREEFLGPDVLLAKSGPLEYSLHVLDHLRMAARIPG